MKPTVADIPWLLRQLAEQRKESTVKRGYVRHGRSNDPTYLIWMSIKHRCYSKYNKSFRNYGGRGIIMCDRWKNDFSAFAADMGDRPSGKSIDRIDVNGNYEPGNCRWATPSEQARNRRLGLKQADVEAIKSARASGAKLSELAARFGVAESTVSRIANGATWRP